MQIGKELCVESNPNVKLVETYGTGMPRVTRLVIQRLSLKCLFCWLPLRSTRQMRMIEILEQTATHFLVASNYWGSDCLINWVAFEPL